MDDTWAEAAEMCDRLLAGLDEIAESTTARIRTDFPDYVLVPIDEHLLAVREQLQRRLEAFKEARPWGPNDIDQAVELAKRRARQSLPLDTLICAYHVGDRELWERINADPIGAPAALPRLTSLMLESMQAISTALVASHNTEARAQESIRASVSQRMLELLSSGHDDHECARLSMFLGFDPAGEFQALAWIPREQHAVTQELQIVSALMDGVVAHAQFQSDSLIVLQGGGSSSVEQARVELSRLGLLGEGGIHSGIAGAALSVEQARVAVTSATARAPLSRFSENWLTSCVISQKAVVDGETARAVGVARSHPHLAETLQWFADADMSVAACARASHLHVNTVAYRLDRWHELSGWDPRNFRELAQSAVACVLAEVDGG